MGSPDADAPQTLRWSITTTAVGEVLLIASPRGLRFVQISGSGAHAFDEVLEQPRWANAVPDDASLTPIEESVAALASGRAARPVPTDAIGTDFQQQVWNHLPTIPRGQTRTYSEVARALGRPTSVRAVAAACARNPIALVVPCHRVIRSDGQLAGYRWGVDVKRALLDAESV